MRERQGWSPFLFTKTMSQKDYVIRHKVICHSLSDYCELCYCCRTKYVIKKNTMNELSSSLIMAHNNHHPVIIFSWNFFLCVYLKFLVYLISQEIRGSLYLFSSLKSVTSGGTEPTLIIWIQIWLPAAHYHVFLCRHTRDPQSLEAHQLTAAAANWRC